MHKLKITTEGEPLVDQGKINDWLVSWNPDDGRFYVEKDSKVRTFKEWRNAVYYCKTH